MSNQLANFASGVGQYDITLFNGPVMDTSAVMGTADLSFNAASMQYAKFTHEFSTNSASTGNGISFSGWFYPSGSQTVGSALFNIVGDTTSVSLYFETPTTLAGYYNGVKVVSTYELTPNMWHFFSYTIFCTLTQTALQSLYVDNPTVNAAVLKNTAIYAAFSSTGNNYLGYGGYGNTVMDVSYDYFNGKMDDFRFYNRVITPSEINVLYQFNDRSTNGALTASSITVTSTGNNGYNTATQIFLTGVFSGLNVVRTPNFPTTYGTVNNVLTLTAKDLVSTDGTSWYFLDTTVAQNTTYSYTITPYVLNVSGATSITISNINTKSLTNGYFTTSSAFPSLGNYSTAPTLAGWTVTLGSSPSQYYLCNGAGSSVGINNYTGTLPSNIPYYVSMMVATSSSLSQTISLYRNFQGTLRFYAWSTVDDVSSTNLTVSIGGWVLLNSYTFDSGNGVPFTSFSLPCNISTPGNYPLTFTVTNNNTNTSSNLCIGGIQLSMTSTAGDAFSAIDPSMLVLYYPMDDVSGTGRLYNYATGAAVVDASLVNANIQIYSPIPQIGTGYLYTSGETNSYAQMSNWTCPTNTVNNGFSIAGWMYPSTIPRTELEPSGGTMVTSNVYSLANTSGGRISLFMKQFVGGTYANNLLDFSCNGVRGAEMELSGNMISPNKWAFFTMTCSGRSDGSGNYNYYINDVCMGSMVAAWPNVTSSYTKNYLGGVPANSVLALDASTNVVNYPGCIDDFRVYNRKLTSQDIFSLWSLGHVGNVYSNVIDPVGMNFYYSFDQ